MKKFDNVGDTDDVQHNNINNTSNDDEDGNANDDDIDHQYYHDGGNDAHGYSTAVTDDKHESAVKLLLQTLT